MTFPSLNLGSWAGIAAAAAVIGTCWHQLRTGLGWFTDLFVCRVMLKEETSRAVMALVWRKAHPSPFGMRLFGGITSFVAPKRRVEVVGYEGVMSEARLFVYGRAPLIVKVGLTGSEAPNVGYQTGSGMPTQLWFIRGTIDIDALLEEAITQYNDVRQSHESTDAAVRKVKRFSVVRMHGQTPNRLSETYASKSIDVPTSSVDAGEILSQLRRGEVRPLIWRPEDLTERPADDHPPFACHPIPAALAAQLGEIGTWLKAEQWFRSRGVPWRRGYLLASEPGAGKDTLIRNLAILHDLPIYAFDLSTYDNALFTTDWKTVMQNAPAIALISDIDATFDGRVNIAAQGKSRDGLTFDCLLNTISGVGSSDGVLLFITTNKLATVDPALGQPTNGDSKSTRPGRIDRVIRMGPMEEPERRRLAALILSDYPDLIEETVAAGEGEMAAQFQDRCATLAQARFWSTHS